ncbi:HopJ type III effector protein [Photobacterium toruni]|uniref:HopJ type III effector protein n=1 Tax=Photobacterium toruni TaxID=1935446 RepID=A0A1T4QAJ6_9GAMM|nr:HopJ type III effector protein [Photobacterium toruni]MEC6830948.1 HopJ type III effector protein [Photobacterium toruni]SKA00667.1 HopJ type III effector protein [Photobacterium toruni]
METLIERIKNTKNNVKFQDIITAINNNYHYQPTQFINGPTNNAVINLEGTNEGSCKIFAFAHLHQLSKSETLACFGTFYRDDVIKHPHNNDHQNIRQFMISGPAHIHFERFPLTLKKEK